MDIFILCILIVLGIVLMLTEMLLTPGFGLSGIGSIVAFVYANYYAFTELGSKGGFITLFISILAITSTIVFILRSHALDKLELKKNIDSTVATTASKDIKIGDTGTTITRLTLIGNAIINGHTVEVKSMNGFIDENTPIVVVNIDEKMILVEKAEQ